MIAAIDQTCLDGLEDRVGFLRPCEPAWNRGARIDLAPLRKSHGASRLINESWIAVETQRLRDIQFLVKQRPGGDVDREKSAKKD